MRDKGDTEAALADFNRAIELSPTTGFLYLERGALMVAKGEDAAAQKDFDKAIKIDPSLKPMVEARIKQEREKREGSQQ